MSELATLPIRLLATPYVPSGSCPRPRPCLRLLSWSLSSSLSLSSSSSRSSPSLADISSIATVLVYLVLYLVYVLAQSIGSECGFVTSMFGNGAFAFRSNGENIILATRSTRPSRFAEPNGLIWFQLW